MKEPFFDLLHAHESYRQYLWQKLDDEIRLVPRVWNYKTGMLPLVAESELSSEDDEPPKMEEMPYTHADEGFF